DACSFIVENPHAATVVAHVVVERQVAGDVRLARMCDGTGEPLARLPRRNDEQAMRTERHAILERRDVEDEHRRQRLLDALVVTGGAVTGVVGGDCGPDGLMRTLDCGCHRFSLKLLRAVRPEAMNDFRPWPDDDVVGAALARDAAHGVAAERPLRLIENCACALFPFPLLAVQARPDRGFPLASLMSLPFSMHRHSSVRRPGSSGHPWP